MLTSGFHECEEVGIDLICKASARTPVHGLLSGLFRIDYQENGVRVPSET